ncbi:MAG: NAD(P)-binding domain-containing protein [Pseudomonadota bacterium]
MANETRTVGFIGLGGMGRGLVKNLLRVGFDVKVFDLDAAALANAEGQGAVRAATATDAARDVDFVAVCVTTAEAVQAIAFGPDGAFAAMRPGAQFVDHTTVSPAHVDAMSAGAAAAGVR